VDSRWEIERTAVRLESCSLGEGEFGRVVKAKLMNVTVLSATTTSSRRRRRRSSSSSSNRELVLKAQLMNMTDCATTVDSGTTVAVKMLKGMSSSSLSLSSLT